MDMRTGLLVAGTLLAGFAQAKLVAKWDFNNYDSSCPTSNQVLRATVGTDGVACTRGSSATASAPITDGSLGSMYVVSSDYSGSDTEAKTAAAKLGAGNYALAIPVNYHVKLPIPDEVKGHVWSMKIRFWSPAVSAKKYRSLFDLPTDRTPAWGKLLIRASDNKIGGGWFEEATFKAYGVKGSYTKVISSSAWHTVTISAGEQRTDLFLDETTECVYSNTGYLKNKFANADSIILNADTYSGGDEGELMYIDSIEFYDDASTYAGKAPHYSKAGLTGEWTFPAANPLQATVGRDLEGYTYSKGTINNPSRTDGVLPGDTCVRTYQKSGFKAYHGLPASSSYTVVMDVRAPSSSTQGYRALFQPDPNNASYYSCLYFYEYNKLYVNKSTFVGINYTKDTWARLVCTYTHGGNRVCYLNGTQVDSRTSPGKCQVTGDHFYFGVDNTGSDYDADFSYIAIYDRVLSAAEVAELHARPLAQDATGAFIPSVAPAGQWQTDGAGGFTAVKGSALVSSEGGFAWTRASAPSAATYVFDLTLPATQTAGGTLVANAASVASGIYGTGSTYSGSFTTTTVPANFLDNTQIGTWGYWSENALDRTAAHRLAVTWAANGRVHYYVDGEAWGQLFPLYANTSAKPTATMSFLNGLGAAVTEIRAYDAALTPDEVAALGAAGSAATGTAPTVAVTASTIPDPVRALVDAASFTVTGTATDGTYLSYAVDWGDGAGDASTALVASGTAQTFTHVYSQPGTYTPTFRAISQGGLVGSVAGAAVTVVSAQVAARDVLLTWPWQQNVYTNRFTIMCEGVKDATDSTKWDGLEVQYGADYAQRATMTRIAPGANANTWIYTAHITVENADGTEIPYRLGYFGLPLTYTNETENTAGVVKLWSQNENESFSCAIWGDNQEGAKAGDWDSDRYQFVRAAFRHAVAQNVDFGLTTGDMASSANYASQIKPGVLVATDEIFGRTRPYYVAWGNHDTAYANNKPYFETGAVDEPAYANSASGNYYLYRNGVLFIFIDHGLMAAAATKTWLADLLATPRAQAAKFRFLLHHFPMWNEDYPIENGAQSLLATAQAGKVDAVFSGHVHCYEHIDHEGLVQITNGGFGWLDHSELVRTCYGADTVMGGHKPVPYLWARQKSRSETNVLGGAEPVVMGNIMSYGELRVEGNTCRYLAHGFHADGTYIGVFDDFTLVSKTVAAPAASSAPAGEPVYCADNSSFAEFTAKPVTNAKWAEYKTAVGEPFTYADGADNAPVVNVSKDEINAFLTWLNGTTGTYRLPTIGELRTAFGDQLARTVSEWSATEDRTTGRCYILGSPAGACAGTWATAGAQPEIGNARCHANYLGFRLATGAAPAEPANTLAEPLAALAAIETPAAAYTWTDGALVDISDDFFGAGARVYNDPVILTGTGAIVREGNDDLTLNAGLAAPNSTSFTKSGTGTLTVKGTVQGGPATNWDGWVLDAGAGALALDGVTYTGEGVLFKNDARTVRLAGANDFASATFTANASDRSVTNFVAAADAATSLTARNFFNLSAKRIDVATNVTLRLRETYRAVEMTLWVDGTFDAAGIDMAGDDYAYVYGAGTVQIGWRRSFYNSWTTFGVSNLCFTSGNPIRESARKNSDGYNVFMFNGPQIRITSICPFTIPAKDVLNQPIYWAEFLSETNTTTLVFDLASDVTFAPTHAGGKINEHSFTKPWNLVKQGAGTLTLKKQVPGAATVRDGFVKIAQRPTASGATASAADGAWQIDDTLTFSAEQTMTGAFAAGGTLKYAFGSSVTPGDWPVLYGSGRAAGDFTVTTDLAADKWTVTELWNAAGDLALRVQSASAPKTAEWTNGGDRANPLDAANWRVTSAGEVVPGAVPDASTTILVSGETALNAPADAGLAYGGLILANPIKLTADCDWTGFSQLFLPANAVIDLGGHTLTMRITVAETFRLRGPQTFTNGTLNVASGGWFKTDTQPSDCRTVNLVMGAALNLTQPLQVRDYTAKFANASYNTGTVALDVYGTFTPESPCFYGCTLQDGATLNLGSQTNVWSTTSAFTSAGRKTISFADNATIGLDFGARKIPSLTKVVTWTAAPANLATLTFTSSSAKLIVESDGIYAIQTGLMVILR